MLCNALALPKLASSLSLKANELAQTRRTTNMAMNIGSPSGGGEPEVMMDINTTPLIDVMLVLLIMLIITIPAQLHSVNMDMPVGTPPARKVDPIVIKIDINPMGVVIWNGTPVQSRAELDQNLAQAYAMQPQPELHIRPQAKAKYETVAAVLASAQRIGLTKLGIVGTEQFVN
jgi:biopolymer transport protein ExbD